MFKFLVPILKQKKLIFSLLLVFVVMGFVIPHTAIAGSPTNFEKGLAGESCTVSIPCALGNLARALTGLLLFIPLILAGIFSFIAGTLLKLVVLLSISGVSYTSLDPALNPAISVGWPITRNLANLVIVLALIVIALATILRYQAYEAKKLLPGLIIAAILINFSLVMCGVVIDVSNIAMKEFLMGGQKLGSTAAGFLSTSELKTAKTLYNEGVGSGAISIFIAKILGNIFYFITKGVVAFLFVFLFLFRIMALWILVILSPLAFACYVLPSTKKIVFDPWREAFIQWCFIGVSAALFIYIGDKLNSAMTTFAGFKGITSGAGGEAFTQSLTGLFTFFVPGMFMVISFIYAMKISVMGSEMAIKAGKYVKGQTMGAVKGTGAFMANKTGLTRAKDNVVDRATRLGESLGVVTKGTAAINQQERLKKNNAEKQTAALDAEGRKKVALGKAQGLSGGPIVTEKARVRRAEAIRQVFKNKEEKNYTPEQRKEMAEFAKKMGIPVKDLTENNPDLLTGQDTKKDGLIRTELKRIPGVGRLAQRQGEKEAVRSLKLKKKAELEKLYLYNPEKAKKLLKEYKPDDNTVRLEQQALRNEKIQERVLGYSGVTSQQIKEKAMENAIESQKDAWKKDIETKNPNMGADARELLLQDRISKAKKDMANAKPNTDEFLKAQQDLVKEKKKKAIGKLTGPKALELPKDAINPESMVWFKANTLKYIGERGPAELIEQFKKYKRKVDANGVPLLPNQQSEEAQKLDKLAQTLSQSEKDNLKDTLDTLESDANFGEPLSNPKSQPGSAMNMSKLSNLPKP